MSSSKKIKLTDHFKITSRPRDPFRNISNQNQQLKQQQQQPESNQKAPLPELKGPHQQQQQPLPLLELIDEHQEERHHENNLNLLHTKLQYHPPKQQQQKPLQQSTTTHLINNKPIHPLFIPKKQQAPLQPLKTNASTRPTLQIITSTSSDPLCKPPKHPPSDYTPDTINKYTSPPLKAQTVVDFDRHNLGNIFWESHYAWDCFEYDRHQEVKFKLHRDALNKLDNNNEIQRLSPQRWAELVDWLVTIQIRFGLEHEPVFMAVKLADNYLANKFVADDQDVLLFIVAILISAKCDERVPPLLISDLTKLARTQFGVRFSRKQVINFEIDLLTTLNFHIRFPSSYGFLRRFAMCIRSDVRTLHLARYILESSLMEYDMIEILDSKIAAGSLLLAFKMLHQNGAWTDTAVYYSGYEEKELEPLVKRLNELIIVLSKKRTTIRQKYRHESFKEVARIPPLLTEQL